MKPIALFLLATALTLGLSCAGAVDPEPDPQASIQFVYLVCSGADTTITFLDSAQYTSSCADSQLLGYCVENKNYWIPCSADTLPNSVGPGVPSRALALVECNVLPETRITFRAHYQDFADTLAYGILKDSTEGGHFGIYNDGPNRSVVELRYHRERFLYGLNRIEVRLVHDGNTVARDEQFFYVGPVPSR